MAKKAAAAPIWFRKFDFGDALSLLKQGVALTREGWNGKHYVQVQLPDDKSANTLPYLFIVTEKGERVPWIASQTDLLSDDWMVYEQ